MRYTTADGDRLDLICWEVYATDRRAPLPAGTVEAVLAANPGLAAHGPVLPVGLVIELPTLPAATAPQPLRLWG